MTRQQHDLIVIGAGPGGYVAAIRGAQLGLNVGCIEKEAALGGTCLRIGCIPSKALLESSELYHEAKESLAAHGVRCRGVELVLAAMQSRKDKIVGGLAKGVEALLKQRKITRYQGQARFESAGRLAVEGKKPVQLEAKHIIIATGSKPRGLEGVEFDDEYIGTSTEALAYDEVPRHLVVIGAGAIGLELGSVWRRLGAKVTVLEYLDRILPEMDGETAAQAAKIFTKQGLELRLSTRVTAARPRKQGAVVESEGQEPLRCDRVLVAVGRVPNTDGLALDAAGVEIDKSGRIVVSDHFQTNVEGVYAIGDVIRGPMLAHKAEDEGIACVERIVTGYGHVNYDAIPNVVYTQPEIASVGRTAEQLDEQEIAYRKGIFSFRGNARARVLAHAEGQVKILADAKTDRILGVHVIGPRAGDLIAEAAAAIEFGATSEDVARTSHAHPTLAEVMKEAALAVDKRALHG
ncbi:MAG: dihydrolipoyl dehydrogenase [Pirellulales bacterium]